MPSNLAKVPPQTARLLAGKTQKNNDKVSHFA